MTWQQTGYLHVTETQFLISSVNCNLIFASSGGTNKFGSSSETPVLNDLHRVVLEILSS